VHKSKNFSVLFIGFACLFMVIGCTSTKENQEVTLLLDQACNDFEKLRTNSTYDARTILFDQIVKNFLLAGQLANSAEFISYSLYAGSDKSYLANMRPEYAQSIEDFCESR
jgi:hypothetical protein